MKYACLDEKTRSEGTYSIIPIREEDMSAIREWRNDQMEILRQKSYLTNQDQVRYWEHVLEPSSVEEKPGQVLFTFLKDDVPIGYGGMTHIDWDSGRAEVSFLLDSFRVKDKETYSQEFTVFLTLLKRVAFEELRLHRLFTETFDLRPVHIGTLEEFGFELEGTLKDHVKIGKKYYNSLIHGLLNND